MKKFILLLCAALLVITLAYLEQEGLPDGTLRVVRCITLPLKLALLYTREPERKLLMPVADARVSSIQNIWHAPRSVERLHERQDIFPRSGTDVYSATQVYVMRIGENALGGKTAFVAGVGARSYYYVHHDNYAPWLAAGDWVTPETVLGYVGTTETL